NGAPGKQMEAVGDRAVERYEQLLRCHVVPLLGPRRLQQIKPAHINDVYSALREGKLAPKTQRHVHTVLKACLDAAVRAAYLTVNPIKRALRVPKNVESDHGQVLEPEQLKELLHGFRHSALYPIVATAIYTGARRGEILALRWDDLNVEKKTLRIERAIDETKAHGRRLKAPKTKRGVRTIEIGDDLITLLKVERDKHRRI